MIYFIRHGESEANLKHYFAGQKDDCPLTEKGREQAREAGAKIKNIGLKIDQVVSSPLIRAIDTARIVSTEIRFTGEPVIDPRITEYDMGTLTGTPLHEITSAELTGAEGAEDPAKFMARIRSFLEGFGSQQTNILLVSHAGVGRMIEIIRHNGNPALFYDLPAYPNASITILDWLK